MGLNTNQMITRSDVQSLTRGGVFFTKLNKCVTKGECDKYHLLVTSGSRASNLLIPKTDLSLGRTFTIYYGIWNDKDVQAQLDKISVQIETNGSWTTVGSVTLSALAANSVKTGSISCTIPTTIDMTDPDQGLRVYCGKTLYDQYWNFCWRSSSNITNLGFNDWGTARTADNLEINNAKEVYSWKAYFMATATNQVPVLKSEAKSETIGTITSRAACFRIQ